MEDQKWQNFAELSFSTASLGKIMIQIRQHGDNGELFDIKDFLLDIDLYFLIDTWVVCIEWCQGLGSKEIERISKNGLAYTDQEFRCIYKDIFQTIDGHFELKSDGKTVVELLAFDSSYWEISSENDLFISHMLKKYGEYGGANA